MHLNLKIILTINLLMLFTIIIGYKNLILIKLIQILTVEINKFYYHL